MLFNSDRLLGWDIGFDAVNAGPLQNARQLEARDYFNIQLGHECLFLPQGQDQGVELHHLMSASDFKLILK
jgi:8-hydroxy-5-deazaflavin:NADPH oxidoreductase